MNAYSQKNNSLDPLTVYRGHTSIVEDVAWHCLTDSIFASVGDDRQLLLFVDYHRRL